MPCVGPGAFAAQCQSELTVISLSILRWPKPREFHWVNYLVVIRRTSGYTGPATGSLLAAASHLGHSTESRSIFNSASRLPRSRPSWLLLGHDRCACTSPCSRVPRGGRRFRLRPTSRRDQRSNIARRNAGSRRTAPRRSARARQACSWPRPVPDALRRPSARRECGRP